MATTTNTTIIRLEVGKKYRTRDGRVAEIIEEDLAYDEDSHSRWDGLVGGETCCWRYDGRYLHSGEMLIDLVEEIIETPVQLKTTPDLTAEHRTRIAKLAARITLADGPVLSIDELAGMTVGELVTRLDGVTDIYGI